MKTAWQTNPPTGEGERARGREGGREGEGAFRLGNCFLCEIAVCYVQPRHLICKRGYLFVI